MGVQGAVDKALNHVCLQDLADLSLRLCPQLVHDRVALGQFAEDEPGVAALVPHLLLVGTMVMVAVAVVTSSAHHGLVEADDVVVLQALFLSARFLSKKENCLPCLKLAPTL